VTTNAWKGATDSIGHWLAKMWSKVRGEEFNITPPKPPFEDILKGTVSLRDAAGEVEELWVKAFDDVRASGEKAADQTAAAWDTANRETQRTMAEAASFVADEQVKVQKAAIAENLDAVKQAAKEEIAELRAAKAAKEAIAKETVRSYIDGIRNKRKADAQWVRDQARAERLRGQSGRGATDFVSAVDAIRGAREGAPAMAANLKAAEANAQQLDMSRNRSLSTMTSELKGIRKDNAALMAAG